MIESATRLDLSQEFCYGCCFRRCKLWYSSAYVMLIKIRHKLNEMNDTK